MLSLYCSLPLKSVGSESDTRFGWIFGSVTNYRDLPNFLERYSTYPIAWRQILPVFWLARPFLWTQDNPIGVTHPPASYDSREPDRCNSKNDSFDLDFSAEGKISFPVFSLEPGRSCSASRKIVQASICFDNH